VVVKDIMDNNQGERHVTHNDWLRARVAKEAYWFHRIEIAEDLTTPGWSDPKSEKLPHYGLPEDMSGMRVLDIGCAEGFFSFEAERRGAREVIAIDAHPDSIRRFNICRDALDSRATGFLTSIYDVSARTFGTFDLVMFFGVLYHLRNPLAALERIVEVCKGTILLQTAGFEDAAIGDQPIAKFHPFGIESGPPEKRIWDPTVLWIPNAACVKSMLEHVGFNEIRKISDSAGLVFRARALQPSLGAAPDESKAPWS
jgi:tRNA (mo5U34)-methyltransferase